MDAGETKYEGRARRCDGELSVLRLEQRVRARTAAPCALDLTFSSSTSRRTIDMTIINDRNAAQLTDMGYQTMLLAGEFVRQTVAVSNARLLTVQLNAGRFGCRTA